MSALLISTKGQIVLPVAVRQSLGLKPGMHVNVKISGKSAQITPAPTKKTVNHALSHGCENFWTLDADLVKRAARATARGPKVTPLITRL